MKIFKSLLLVFVLALGIVIYLQYPRLNIISGYAAKSMCSCMFEAGRSQANVMATDNNFSPINIARYEVDTIKKSVTASVKGLMKRTAVYHEDIGCQLLLKNESKPEIDYYPVPHNCPAEAAFPYGNEAARDSLFANVDYSKLENAVTGVFDREGVDSLKTRSILVVYKNHIIAENYASGFDKNSKLLGWSMAKSLLATLFGVLEKQEKIRLESTNLFGEWENDERANITLQAMLQMNSGLEWDENYDKISDVTKMLFLEKDVSQMQLHKSLATQVNHYWNYSSGITNLLSAYLRKQFATHEDYLDFPVKELFDKIGASSMMMETDLSGNYVASSYAWANTRDWAKLGLLYLHKGNWNGEQVISESWVDFVGTPTESSSGTYGAHFYVDKEKWYTDVPNDLYFMDGYQGQRVFIIPSYDLVVVRMGLSDIDFNQMLKEILGAIENGK